VRLREAGASTAHGLGWDRRGRGSWLGWRRRCVDRRRLGRWRGSGWLRCRRRGVSRRRGQRRLEMAAGSASGWRGPARGASAKGRCAGVAADRPRPAHRPGHRGPDWPAPQLCDERSAGRGWPWLADEANSPPPWAAQVPCENCSPPCDNPLPVVDAPVTARLAGGDRDPHSLSGAAACVTGEGDATRRRLLAPVKASLATADG